MFPAARRDFVRRFIAGAIRRTYIDGLADERTKVHNGIPLIPG